MRKNIVGDWGSHLSDPDYARALAALGCLEARGTIQHRDCSDKQKVLEALQEEFKDGDITVRWRQAHNVGKQSTPESWRETRHEDAQTLTDGWRLYLDTWQHPRQRPRLAVNAAWRNYPHLFDFDELLQWLGSPEVGCEALVLAPAEIRATECQTTWHWPLRVGVPTGFEGEAVLETFRHVCTGWIEHLSLLQPVGEARDFCDLLIIPGGMAARLMEQPRLRLRTSFAICLEPPLPWSSAGDSPWPGFCNKLGAAGIALVGQMGGADLAGWYERLIQELSHDLPVQAAVWKAGSSPGGSAPIIMGVPEALDRLRILAVAKRLDHKHEVLQVGIRGPSRGLRGVTRPPEDLSRRVRQREFRSETGDGRPTADEFAKETADLEGKRQLRYIQAQAWRDDTGTAPARALAPQGPNVLTVHIGPAKDPLGTPFPDYQFDFSSGPVDLYVQVSLSGAAIAAIDLKEFPEKPDSILEWLKIIAVANNSDRITPHPDPLPSRGEGKITDKILSDRYNRLSPIAGGEPTDIASAAIRLPLAGDSSRAVFTVLPLAGVSEVTGRIAIIHRNRIVQTARWKAAVAEAGFEGPGITVEPEAMVHPRLDDLAERRTFDAALLFSNPTGGLIISSEGKDQRLPLENLKSAVENIRTALHAGAAAWDYSKVLKDQPALQPILLKLACSGRLLFDMLQDKLGQEIGEAERVQLLCCGNAFFPLEYLYEGPPPKIDPEAAVCRNFLDGTCQEMNAFSWKPAAEQPGCASTFAKSPDYLCPMHFWGFTRVIERHIAPAASDAGEESEEQRYFPVPSRDRFGPITSVLFGVANRALLFRDTPQEQKQEIQDLEKSLGNLGSLIKAESWEEWQKYVEQDGPNVLVLIVHTDKKAGVIDVLEIGDGKLLGKHEIIGNKEKFIGKKEEKQLLLLLGCSTAGVTEDFAPYSEVFQKAGADVILAPLASIRGADALSIAKLIARLLSERLAGNREAAFGELLRELRQKLLGAGHPGVLGLLGFGDADWVFGG